MAITAKISKPSHQTLKQMSEKTGKSIQLILDEAVELYRRELFFQELNQKVMKVKSNAADWGQELLERKNLEGSLADDLDSTKDEI